MSVNEPFHLASYAVPRASKTPHNLYATHAQHASEGYVTATAQGDGVHVLDLATLHPIISHTLGPSTTFSCPSVSVLEPENVCTTYAAIASSSDVSLDACRKTVWAWRESVSSTDRAAQKRKAVVLPHEIARIHACSPHSILIASQQGDWTLVDADLKVRSTTSTSSTVLQSFVFDNAFLPAYRGNTTVVALENAETSTSVRVLVVIGDAETREVGQCTVSVRPDQIATASCSNSGYLSVLTKDGSWTSFQLESSPEGIAVYEPVQPLRLKSLSTDEASVVALNTSLVLLAAVTSASRSIVLLLWDLQYSVLIASHTFTIPSTLSALPKLSVTLGITSSANSPQALLVIAPPTTNAAPPKSARSSIFSVPLTFPKSSSLGNAIGRADAGRQWLELDAPEETSQNKVLTSVKKALGKKDPTAAEEAFFAWEASDGFGHSFVCDILAAVFDPANAYSPRIVKFLLEKRVVSASMVEDGLLAALIQRNDWNAIQLSTQTVIDITESDLVGVLRHVLEAPYPAAADAMDVDSDSSSLGTVPTLPSFLTTLIMYPTAPTPLRIALHAHLTDPASIQTLLSQLDKWLVHWRNTEIVVLPSKKSLVKDACGVMVLKAPESQPDPKTNTKLTPPALPKILPFLQTLLDASLLLLLQHTPAHPVLRSILSHIEPEIKLTETIEPLRGPLDIFSRAQAKAVRDAKDKQNGVGKDQGDWRQRRKAKMEMAVGGVYQLEEIVL
ncbi:hypothetical protein MKEN_01233300 [Mycena kentingensis (nom. inval.)]|nr:hypothetical protein MKEN_01233300 [Mycena kentingensis (nom. inval.)]